MTPWLTTLLSQQDTAPAPSWLDSLGPFVAFGGLALIALWWLARQLAEERRANRELSDRLVTMAEQVLPILQTANRTLEEADRALEHYRRRAP